MQLIFTFTINTDTQEYASAGNIPMPEALQKLLQLVISEAVNEALEAKEESKGVP